MQLSVTNNQRNIVLNTYFLSTNHLPVLKTHCTIFVLDKCSELIWAQKLSKSWFRNFVFSVKVSLFRDMQISEICYWLRLKDSTPTCTSVSPHSTLASSNSGLMQCKSVVWPQVFRIRRSWDTNMLLSLNIWKWLINKLLQN